MHTSRLFIRWSLHFGAIINLVRPCFYIIWVIKKWFTYTLSLETIKLTKGYVSANVEKKLRTSLSYKQVSDLFKTTRDVPSHLKHHKWDGEQFADQPKVENGTSGGLYTDTLPTELYLDWDRLSPLPVSILKGS